MNGPLAGIRVIEIGQAVAGPMAGMILGDMGAEVIKIEKPDGGDDARGWGPPFIDGDSMLFHSMNRNKKSVTLDIKNPDDVAKLKTLVAEADILIQNLRSGIVAELGIGPDVMCALNPRLIYCSVWAFGKNGPLRNAPGFDPLLQAYGGVMSLTGRPDDPPTFCAPAINDRATAQWCVIGALGALQARHHNRQGLRDRHRAVRQRGGVGRRAAQRLQPHRKTAAAVRRRQFYAGAVSGVRNLGPADLHRRRQRPAVREMRRRARPSGMGQRSALPARSATGRPTAMR